MGLRARSRPSRAVLSPSPAFPEPQPPPRSLLPAPRPPPAGRAGARCRCRCRSLTPAALPCPLPPLPRPAVSLPELPPRPGHPEPRHRRSGTAGGGPGPVPLRPAAGRAEPGAVRSRQLGGPDRHQQPHRHHREAPFQKQGFMNNFQHFVLKVSCKRLPSSIFFSTSRWRNVGSPVPFFPRRPIARTPRGSVSDVCQGHRHTSQTAVVDGMSGNQRESPAETPARHRSSHIWHTADGRFHHPTTPLPDHGNPTNTWETFMWVSPKHVFS